MVIFEIHNICLTEKKREQATRLEDARPVMVQKRTATQNYHFLYTKIFETYIMYGPLPSRPILRTHYASS